MKKVQTYAYDGQGRERLCDAGLANEYSIHMTPDAKGFPLFLTPSVALYKPRYTVADKDGSVTVTRGTDVVNSAILWAFTVLHSALFAVSVYNYFFDKMMPVLFVYSALMIAVAVFYGTLTRRLARTTVELYIKKCLSNDAKGEESR